MDIKELNKKVLNEINNYLNLDIYDKKFPCPYYINFIEFEFNKLMQEAGIKEEDIEKVHEKYKNGKALYGWYRGKGTAKEIENAVIQLAELREFDLKGASKEAIIEFMKILGLGIDCSGYVFNILKGAISDKEFLNSLNWVDEKMTVSRAGVNIFCEHASKEIELKEIQPLDIIIIKSKFNGENSHMGLLIKKEDGLYLTQSSLSTIPTGVRVDKFDIADGKPKFGFEYELGTTIDEFYNQGLIEFRRLNYLS
jgi:hypothetical protein